MKRFWPLLVVVLSLCLLPVPQASAQHGVSQTSTDTQAMQELHAGGQPLSKETVRDLVARLSDEEVRQLLLERLDAQASSASAASGDDMAGALLSWRDAAARFHANFGAMLAGVPDIPLGVARALESLPRAGSATVLFWIALGFAAMMVAGVVVERLLRHALRDLWQQVNNPDHGARLSRPACLLLRLVMEAGFLLAFIAGAALTFFALWHGNDATRSVITTYLTAVVVVRIYVIFSHFLLAPRNPKLRLTRMPDAATTFLHRQNIVMVCIAAFGFLTCRLLQELGLGNEPYQAMQFSVGVVLFATLVYTILRARKAISVDLAWNPGEQSRFRLLLAETWPGLTAAFVALLYLTIVLLVFTGHPVSYLSVFGTLFAVIFVPHFDVVFERRAKALEEEKASAENPGGQIRSVAYRAGRIALYFLAAIFVMRIWEVDLFSLAQRSVGGRIAGALVDIGLTALVAYVLWGMARIAIDRRLAQEDAGEGDSEEAGHGDQGGQGLSRIRTLLPLMRATIQVTILVMAVMLVLSSLGVNIGPLLAGAGVIGLAVGFGAQTLVRDIVSGVFFLIDDAFRFGEYIDVGSVKGTVEKISLRSLRLRHHRGALHTIPFGEIQHLTNYSRDWAIMKLEFRVPFDTDLEEVRKIFKKIGQELLVDEEMGPDFLEPFKSQGVLQTDDSAFVIRGKFMAKPGRQFLIRRAIFQRVQQAFAAAGIHFADRRVTVNVPGAEHMSPEERAAVEKAAGSAVAAAQAEEDAVLAKG